MKKNNEYNESVMTEKEFYTKRIAELSQGATTQELKLVFTYLKALKGLN